MRPYQSHHRSSGVPPSTIGPFSDPVLTNSVVIRVGRRALELVPLHRRSCCDAVPSLSSLRPYRGHPAWEDAGTSMLLSVSAGPLRFPAGVIGGCMSTSSWSSEAGRQCLGGCRVAMPTVPLPPTQSPSSCCAAFLCTNRKSGSGPVDPKEQVVRATHQSWSSTRIQRAEGCSLFPRACIRFNGEKLGDCHVLGD